MATIIDSVIIVLLAGSITYGYLVSRKVRLLMMTLKELEPLVEEFSFAVDKSQNSVSQMRENIEEAVKTPQSEPEARTAQPEQAALVSRRADSSSIEIPGVRVVRDKKDLVRAFFESSGTAAV